MIFQYLYKNKEANFGKPLKSQVKGGTHITFEIVLKYKDKYIVLRRQSIQGHSAPTQSIKNEDGALYFCHDLIRHGESISQCVKRIVRSQAGVGVKSYRVVDIESLIQKKDSQWAFIPHVIAELSKKPKTGRYGTRVTEVVEFTKQSIPSGFAWWEKDELKTFLIAFD